MRITLTHYDRTVSVSIDREGLTLDELAEELLEPALLALGYHPDTIRDLLHADALPPEPSAE